MQLLTKMLVVLLIGILFCTPPPILTLPNVRRFSPLIFEITEPLNALLSGEISQSDFIKDIDLGLQLVASPENSTTFFYESESTTFEEFLGTINPISKLLWDTIGNTTSLQLIIGYTIPVDRELNEQAPVNHSFVTFSHTNVQLSILLNLNNTATCEEFQRGPWPKFFTMISTFFNTRKIFVGMGYSKELEGCNLKFKLENTFHQTNMQFGVINPQWEDGVGVVESLHFFKDRMTYLEEKITSKNELSHFIYYPAKENVGSGNYRRLLIKFADIWISGKSNNNESIIVQVPVSAYNKKVTKNTNFHIIPQLNPPTNQCVNGPNKTSSWFQWAPVLLEAVSLGLKTLLLMPDDWATLNSKNMTKLNILRAPTENNSLKIIWDFTGKASHYTKSLEFNDYLYFTNDLDKYVTIKALVFGFTSNSNQEDIYEPEIHPNLPQNLSSKVTLGCSFVFRSFIDLNGTEIVDACKTINGTIYILKWSIIVSVGKPADPRNLIYHYEKQLKVQLEAINNLRISILQVHPEASVYFQVYLVDVYEVYSGGSAKYLSQEDMDSSIICHETLQDFYKYFEAIVTWAKVNDFPIILNSALKSDACSKGVDWEWFSFLRSYPHDQNEKGSSSSLNSSASSDLSKFYFLNHQNNYTRDECIEWEDGKPNFNNEYFFDNYVGAIFHANTNGINYTGTVLEEVLTTQFQFVFHRFSFQEIVTSSHFQEVILSLKHVRNLPSAPVTNLSVFIGYNNPSGNQNESRFSLLLEEIEKNGINIVKGIHVDLPESTEYLDLSKYFPFQTEFEQKFGTKKTEIMFGITVHNMNIFDWLSDAKILVFLNKVEYIIVKIEFKQLIGIKGSEKNKIAELFHRILYIKRVLQHPFPKLNVYFRIEVGSNINSNLIVVNSENNLLPKFQIHMENYLRLLSQIKKFGIIYNIRIFIVEAFDNNEFGRKNGWWEIKDYEDLLNPIVYVEKEAVYQGRNFWYPPTVERKAVEVMESSVSRWIYIGLAISLFLLLTAGVVGSSFFLQNRKLRQYLSYEEVQIFLNGRPKSQNNTSVDPDFEADCIPFNSVYKLSMSDLDFDIKHLLGKGNFGTVYKGTVKGNLAAIKKPNSDCGGNTFKSFLSEAKVLSYIGSHGNVVAFLGAYTKEIRAGIIYIATEFCSNGSLESLLRSKQSVISEGEEPVENSIFDYDLDRFSREIANGMEYIASKEVVHGDLATRNVLLDENFTCKIGDFGLSRKLYEYKKYVKKSQEPLPWKWMAYESLTKMEFTTKSDVWSYGVTVWEIYSLGKIPYGGLQWSVGFTDELENGLRLTVPRFANEIISAKMQECWDLDPNQRPTFTELTAFFKNLGGKEYIDL